MQKEYLVTFKGGPIGGTTQVFPRLEPRWRVPVMSRDHYWCKPAGSPSMMPVFNEAIYEPDRYTERLNPASTPEKLIYDIEYRWQDPSDRLQQENKKLKALLDEAESKLAEEGKLREAVAVIKGILS